MQQLKISLITITRNAQNTVGRCIESVIAQNYDNLEYIIIDGASTDDTVQIISQYAANVTAFVSEPDNGIYDAMNKGIQMATGDVIGILNADDFFAANDILNNVASVFLAENDDVVYGDLNYLKPNGVILRKWVSSNYKHGLFNWGWMPPHPTFYCKRLVFEQLGGYDLNYGTAADYELMLRFLHRNKLKTHYLNKTMVNMTAGGASNKNYLSRIKAWKNDFKAMRKNGVMLPLIGIVFKPLRKILQYI